VPIVTVASLFELLPRAYCGQSLGSTKTAVGATVVDQELGVLGIDRAALALPIRAKRAADIGPFIPGQTDPAQSIEDHLLGVGARSGLIRVLDAEHKCATGALGERIVEQRNVRGANMGISGRRWCNSHTHRPRSNRHNGPL
jgi:hypothetical protein